MNLDALQTSMTIYCTMLGFFDRFWPPIVRVTPLKTPFGLVIPLLQSQSHVTTITHNYFLRCYTFAQFTNTALQSLLHYSTQSLLLYTVRLHWLTSQLSVTFTDYHTLKRTQSLHFTLRNSRRELTPRIHFLRVLLNWLVELLPKNWLLHSPGTELYRLIASLI
jgi:hypothetical protein